MTVHHLSLWKICGKSNPAFSKIPWQFCQSFYFLYQATFSASGGTTKEKLFKSIKEYYVALCSASFENIIVANFLFSFQYCSTFKRIHWNSDAANSSFLGKCPASVLPEGELLGRFASDQAADWISCVYEGILWCFSSNACEMFLRLYKWRYQFDSYLSEVLNCI